MKRNSGYSLLEVLIALTILAVGLVGTMRLFTQSLDNTQTAAARTSLSQMADAHMGGARAASAKDLLVFRPRTMAIDVEKRIRDLEAEVAVVKADPGLSAAELWAISKAQNSPTELVNWPKVAR